MAEKRCVVLLSGGLDSATAAAMAAAEGFSIYALTLHYGQRHKRELESATLTARDVNAQKHLVLDIGLDKVGGSALTSGAEVPKGDSPATGGIPVTYVPARNTVFLSYALAWAEVLETGDIFIGANINDYSGYPDCRPEYIHAFEHMASLAVKAAVEGRVRFRVNAPLIGMTKAEIIKKGISLGVDYSHTWSCYDPARGENGLVPCGRCDSCHYRAKGFSEAGMPDPLLKKNT
ncbi:MAG: 7-cyano-7-deazaguanine synthase QueC [Actinomycetota bacterium]|nr:7-cyano-7-deazaguanine synthase QueC [Actinomycetota bacterium]